MRKICISELVHPCRKRCYRSTFTLVELLVVISLLALLSGLVIPSVKKGLSSAQSMSCSKNLNSIYTGTMIFSEDHDGLLWSTRGYGMTTYGHNEDTEGWSRQMVEGLVDGQFSHGKGFLEPYIGEVGSDVHFCPGYNRPSDDRYQPDNLRVLGRGHYTGLRERATTGLSSESFTGSLFRMQDYMVTSAYSRNPNTKEYIKWKPRIANSVYRSGASGPDQDASFAFLPLFMDYVPRLETVGWNAGSGAGFYDEGSLIHNGSELPLIYTDGHATTSFFFPYLGLDMGGSMADENLISYLIQDLQE